MIVCLDLDAIPIDFLPIAGDGSGSYLCARLGPHGDAQDLAAIKQSGRLRHVGIPYANFVTGAGDGFDVELMQAFAERLGVGYTLRGRRVLTEVGVEIDQEAVSPSGRVVWFEYKGSVQGNRPGLRRTDTLKKAIANGALLRSLTDPAPYVVVTSHLPESGSGAAMLQAALRLRCFADVVCLYDPSSTRRLARW